ncbi:KilA-N domain-containing protein [Vibrio sp. HA2012]|uniref:KilA-N domain-containing protein n=1 Tax=Vibrio sp. HA2012 TaxID=1971595 RepID=UPI0012FD21C8|nr:KilA-N domain-containing protein [Vibrio sp. HA2012]
MTNINTDLPVIAGIQITTDSEGRFNLNALHKASNAGKHKAPNEWLRTKQAQELILELETQTGNSRSAIKVNNGGINQGTFAHELLVVSYAAWISAKFQLEVNQVFLDLKSGKHQASPSTLDQKIDIELKLIKVASEVLNLSESGKLGMFQNFAEQHGLPSAILPDYAVDKSEGSTIDSSEPTFSATQGLREYNVGISAMAFNKLLVAHGILEQLTRKSSSGKPKKFWSITKYGLRYGKNLTNHKNQKETQAHWYRSSFHDLLIAVGLIEEAA